MSQTPNAAAVVPAIHMVAKLGALGHKLIRLEQIQMIFLKIHCFYSSVYGSNPPAQNLRVPSEEVFLKNYTSLSYTLSSIQPDARTHTHEGERDKCSQIYPTASRRHRGNSINTRGKLLRDANVLYA